MTSGKRIIIFFSVFLLVLYLAGCAGKVDKELGDAEDAKQEAIDAGAEGSPAYQEAEDLLAKAKELMATGDYNGARDKLEEARFKYIEAKGDAISGNWMAGRDMEAESAFLEGQKSLLGSAVGIDDIFFDYDSARVRSDARLTLDQNAGYIMNKSGSYKLIAVEGYCDIRGTEEYNLALGQRRAESVKSYLVGLGVSPAIIQSVSKGETQQWAPGVSEYAYQQNRRAHFVSVSK